MKTVHLAAAEEADSAEETDARLTGAADTEETAAAGVMIGADAIGKAVLVCYFKSTVALNVCSVFPCVSRKSGFQ